MQLNYEEEILKDGTSKPLNNNDIQPQRESTFMQNIDDYVDLSISDIEGANSGQDGGASFDETLNKTNI